MFCIVDDQIGAVNRHPHANPAPQRIDVEGIIVIMNQNRIRARDPVLV